MPPSFDDRFRGNLDALFRWRRDVRRFETRPLADSDLGELLATAALAPSVGLCEPWRFVRVDAPARRAAVAAEFARSNAAALAATAPERQAAYARLKLAGLDEAPCHLAVFAEPDPDQGHGLGRRTMPDAVAYSAVMAVHTLWLAARARGLGAAARSGRFHSPALTACADRPAGHALRRSCARPSSRRPRSRDRRDLAPDAAEAHPLLHREGERHGRRKRAGRRRDRHHRQGRRRGAGRRTGLDTARDRPQAR